VDQAGHLKQDVKMPEDSLPSGAERTFSKPPRSSIFPAPIFPQAATDPAPLVKGRYRKTALVSDIFKK
jgi:hypothetical protein